MDCKMVLHKIVGILKCDLFSGKITDLLEKEISVLLILSEFCKTFYISSTSENKAV